MCDVLYIWWIIGRDVIDVNRCLYYIHTIIYVCVTFSKCIHLKLIQKNDKGKYIFHVFEFEQYIMQYQKQMSPLWLFFSGYGVWWRCSSEGAASSSSGRESWGRGRWLDCCVQEEVTGPAVLGLMNFFFEDMLRASLSLQLWNTQNASDRWFPHWTSSLGFLLKRLIWSTV